MKVKYVQLMADIKSVNKTSSICHWVGQKV